MGRKNRIIINLPVIPWPILYGITTKEELLAWREKQKLWKQKQLECRRAERKRLYAERKGAKTQATAEINAMRKQLRAVIKEALAEEREHH